MRWVQSDVSVASSIRTDCVILWIWSFKACDSSKTHWGLLVGASHSQTWASMLQVVNGDYYTDAVTLTGRKLLCKMFVNNLIRILHRLREYWSLKVHRKHGWKPLSKTTQTLGSWHVNTPKGQTIPKRLCEFTDRDLTLHDARDCVLSNVIVRVLSMV